MNHKNYFPIVLIYGYISGCKKLKFVGREGLITFEGKRKLIQEILKNCNGYNSLKDIVAKMPRFKQIEIEEMIDMLDDHGIISDSRRLFLRFHDDSANPTKFSVEESNTIDSEIVLSERYEKGTGSQIEFPPTVQSNILETLKKRKSTRHFDKGQLSLQKISGILKAAYSFEGKHWSVASGGGLYPLDIYLIVSCDDQAIPPGIYKWNPIKHHLVGLSSVRPGVWMTKIFDSRTLCENVSCVVCVAAKFSLSTNKYSNRGYRLAVLEAGHIAQNIYLFCAEQNIGVVECCGFNDQILSEKLSLKYPDEAVVTTLFLGKIKEHHKEIPDLEQLNLNRSKQLYNSLVGKLKPIKSVSFIDLSVGGYHLPRWAASAEYFSDRKKSAYDSRKSNFSFATGFTSKETLIKVLAEGFERYALEQFHSELKSKAIDLRESYLDPRILVPYTKTQISNLRGITAFNPKKEIDWVSGVRTSCGEKVWVPAELVYYTTDRMKQFRKVCYQASSSGVASHFEKSEAINTAILELIERDAFSVTWYSKRNVKAISHRSLSPDIRYRIEEWKKNNYSVTVLDITLDGPPVVLVMIWSHTKTPALCSGAACRISLFEAVEKAFDEAEFMNMSWSHHLPKKVLSVDEIDSPESHGAFYITPQNLRKVEWLLKSDTSDTKDITWEKDLSYVDSVVVDITPKESDSGLFVVRVLTEKLMPINFGFRNEHRRHHRMRMLGFSWSEKYPSTPHFFA